MVASSRLISSTSLASSVSEEICVTAASSSNNSRRRRSTGSANFAALSFTKNSGSVSCSRICFWISTEESCALPFAIAYSVRQYWAYSASSFCSLPAHRAINEAAGGAATASALSSSNKDVTITRMLRPDGGSEPAISITANGTMGMTTLSWQQLFTHYWSGSFGSTPTFRGEIDSALQLPGQRRVFGGGDADVDLGSTGTLHATTLIFLTPPTVRSFTLGVSAITCRDGTSPTLQVPSDCTSQIIDKAGADRSWITSEHRTVYISYHD